jgi:lysophospholipase L1-like esterase
MARLADVPTVLWLTVRTRAPRPDAPGEINDALRAAAARYPQLELLAYDRWLRGRPGLVAEDGVHLTPSGQRVVAENVRRAVRARTTGPEASRTS